MKQKYRVPALEKANAVIYEIARNPSQLKLMEISRNLSIHKSTLFSMLTTMEHLNWVTRKPEGTYALGSAMGEWGQHYFQQFDLVKAFLNEAPAYRDQVGETVQLARLEENNVYYLAKVEAPAAVRLVSEPGSTFPAHATALGKVLLAHLPEEIIREKYLKGSNVTNETSLESKTSNTITNMSILLEQLDEVRVRGYAVEEEEAVEGFCCLAAPVKNREGLTDAAVSFSIPIQHWEEKRKQARECITNLAMSLSLHH